MGDPLNQYSSVMQTGQSPLLHVNQSKSTNLDAMSHSSVPQSASVANIQQFVPASRDRVVTKQEDSQMSVNVVNASKNMFDPGSSEEMLMGAQDSAQKEQDILDLINKV